jgi:hypothetical protein
LPIIGSIGRSGRMQSSHSHTETRRYDVRAQPKKRHIWRGQRTVRKERKEREQYGTHQPLLQPPRLARCTRKRLLRGAHLPSFLSGG